MAVGSVLFAVGLLAVAVLSHWAFNVEAGQEVVELSVIAPRISQVLPIMAAGVVSFVTGIGFLIAGFIVFLRRKSEL